MTKQSRVSSTLPRKLKELGLSPDIALRRAGLPMGMFKLDKILVSTEEFFTLHRGIAEASNDPAFDLKLGTEERVERYDPVQIAAISARSFRDAIERISRYKQLTCPEEIRIIERGNESAVQFIWVLAHEQEPPFLVDVYFAWIVSLVHQGIGRPLNPKRVEFQRPPAHRGMYEEHFGCPVKFSAAQNALVFSNADIGLPFVTHNADLLGIVAPQLEAELTEQLAQKAFSDHTKGILMQLLAGQRPGIQDLARELHLSTRTLQRRLTEQGVTFQRLVGYEDANSFFRAFQQWEGTSPGQWRLRQKNLHSSTQPH